MDQGPFVALILERSKLTVHQVHSGWSQREEATVERRVNRESQDEDEPMRRFDF